MIIRNGDMAEQYLVFSPSGLSVYHANIVERFCHYRSINGSYNSKRNYYEIKDQEWCVLGGGLWLLDEVTKTIKLHGESQAYGKYDKQMRISLKSATDSAANRPAVSLQTGHPYRGESATPSERSDAVLIIFLQLYVFVNFDLVFLIDSPFIDTL